MGALPVDLQRWTLKRLDDAFQGFFRRLRVHHGKAGFPRFRGKGWWDSFGFAEFSGIRLDGKRLRFAGLPGGLKVHLHRDLPADADIRSCVFRRDGHGWHACLAVAVEAAEKRTVATMVGVDLGLKVFAYCSDGVILPNPKIAGEPRRNCGAGRGRWRGANVGRSVAARFALRSPGCIARSPIPATLGCISNRLRW